MYLLIESPHIDRIRNNIVTNNKVVFEAVLHTADTPNKNGRIYPLEVIKEAVNDTKSKLQDKIFGGELDHPLPNDDEYGSTLRHITLALKEMSHIFTKLWFEDNKLIGRVQTLNTPNGKILANLVSEGIHVGFSLRAFTDNLKKQGQYDVVDSPLSLVAIDAVATPSHSEAKIKRVLKLEENELKNTKDEQVQTLLESFNKMKQKCIVGGTIKSFIHPPVVYDY